MSTSRILFVSLLEIFSEKEKLKKCYVDLLFQGLYSDRVMQINLQSLTRSNLLKRLLKIKTVFANKIVALSFLTWELRWKRSNTRELQGSNYSCRILSDFIYTVSEIPIYVLFIQESGRCSLLSMLWLGKIQGRYIPRRETIIRVESHEVKIPLRYLGSANYTLYEKKIWYSLHKALIIALN